MILMWQKQSHMLTSCAIKDDLNNTNNVRMYSYLGPKIILVCPK